MKRGKAKKDREIKGSTNRLIMKRGRERSDFTGGQKDRLMRENCNKDIEREHTGMHRTQRKIDIQELQIDKEK